MWLPTPIYERMPPLWIVLGLLFFAYGLYIGLDLSASFGAIIMGLICWAYAVAIAIVRHRYRKNPPEVVISQATSH